MPQVPEERPLPYEVPWREVEHQETDDYPDDWGYRSYPIGHVKDTDWWGTPTQHEEDLKRLRERDRKRAELGGFGFHA